jgi:hypothetical protein
LKGGKLEKPKAAKKSGTDEVKHLTLRLPSAPDFVAADDESAALTRLRALNELLTGRRHSLHDVFCGAIENSIEKKYCLPFPKSAQIPAGGSFERFDVRLTQQHLDLIDSLRDQMVPRPDILDFRNYYSRPDVLRELLKFELQRTEQLVVIEFRKT